MEWSVNEIRLSTHLPEGNNTVAPLSSSQDWDRDFLISLFSFST